MGRLFRSAVPPQPIPEEMVNAYAMAFEPDESSDEADDLVKHYPWIFQAYGYEF